MVVSGDEDRGDRPGDRSPACAVPQDTVYAVVSAICHRFDTAKICGTVCLMVTPLPSSS
jgi:hypothetical protein